MYRTQVVDKPPSDLDFGYHSLDRCSADGATESPRPLHTVHEGNESMASREDISSCSTSLMSGEWKFSLS